MQSGKPSGLNSGLPFEHRPIPSSQRELIFELHYFFMRKFGVRLSGEWRLWFFSGRNSEPSTIDGGSISQQTKAGKKR